MKLDSKSKSQLVPKNESKSPGKSPRKKRKKKEQRLDYHFDEITPRLFLGSINLGKIKKLLFWKRITHIICTD